VRRRLPGNFKARLDAAEAELNRRDRELRPARLRVIDGGKG
jgi:hypothetical protein